MFVTFEGLDGSGTTTQTELLRQHLEEAGRDVVATREPGGTELGERVRELVLGETTIAPWAEAALFAAARAQLVEEVIQPALESGADVVCDRYLDSSLAYQGIARGLGVDRVLALNMDAIRGILPDVTFLLLLEPDEARERSGPPGDRIEREGEEFLRAVDKAYRELGSIFAGRIVTIDSSSPPRRSQRRCVTTFQGFPEQAEARRLLDAALAEGPAHAYLFHGPPGVGKRRAALGFAGVLLGDAGRVERRAHPDLYVLEPLGDQIRIDAIRELRHDLHMRPFEADRRVYLVFGAHTLNEEAADALLKDLEEPPPYAVAVLVADDLGPLPETIRSRCQLVPFRRLADATVRDEIAARAPELSENEATALARVARGRLDRVDRLLDPQAARRREAVLELARAVYRDPGFEPRDAADVVMGIAAERADEAKGRAQAENEELDLTPREKEQRTRRAMRGAERDEVLLCLEELEAWYRDLVVVAAGAESAAAHVDRLAELREDATVEQLRGAEAAAEAVRETWRLFEELQLQAGLALEALFVRLKRELAGVPV